MVNGHGTELLHVDAVSLERGEVVIMLCDWGCTLYVNDLMQDFFYKHVARCNDGDELLKILNKPDIRGKKYKSLEYMRQSFCVYEDYAPEMIINLWDDEEWFRAGVMELPVKTEPKVSARRLSDPKDNDYKITSYVIQGTPMSKVSMKLSQIVSTLRERAKSLASERDIPYYGFTVAIFVCREFDSNLDPVKIEDHVKTRGM